MSGAEQRSSERLQIAIPIRVMAFGGTSGSFTEDTHTVEVNAAGARIALVHRVCPDDTLRIIDLENFREADFRVVGLIRLAGDKISEWGVECLDQRRNVWGIEFGPPLAPEGIQAGALLCCRGCGQRAFTPLSIMEAEVLEATGALQRLCSRCGEFSSWVCSETDFPAQEIQPAESAPSATPPEKWDGQAERRAHKRLAFKLPIRIRNHRGDSEVTKTENVSKGGFAVSLSMKLEVGEIVSVICPYTEGGSDLEQRAEVRRRAPSDPGRWRYGCRYVS